MIVRRRLVGHWWCDVALVLTLVASFCNNITLASGDYRLALAAAIACSLAALVAIAVGWTRMTRLGRGLAAILALADAWTLIDAAVRRLPAVT